MQQVCPRCNAISNTSSSFCTNCGATLGTAPAPAPQAYRQSWEAPQGDSSRQTPYWPQNTGGAFGQSAYMNSGQNSNDSLGFGGAADNTAKKLITALGIIVLAAVVLLLFCIAMAFAFPIAGVRHVFLILTILMIVIPWIIYRHIRRLIIRRVGRIWWLF